ncbi:UvrD-helicase domain-containing protein, partial [Helcococcus ovis]
MNINVKQEEAINKIDGPVLIIAGPGTGKTYTLVQRVINMVANLNIDPSQIMISTFTNKASFELIDRLSIKFKELNIHKDVNDMMIGNFHSIARRILDEYIDFTPLKRGYIQIDSV